ncbi:hypothetical protein [Methylobacterium radiodurans]|uniref:Uncharacterized protein n=1 Tax=Methylobacterium radiodurans TaxID=2202828 RepID=A0A2U8VPS6_9HYPH|nr:hypothetical protein [Methylobacterium radiodurans]AWN35699.1 hypothetical protein DK427_08035 [Methylobacterium radiodurans]
MHAALPDPAPMPPGFGPREPVDRSPALEAAMVLTVLRLHASARTVRPPLWRRLWRGVIGHFRLRFPEWWAMGELLLFGWTLYSAVPVFAVSPNMTVMAAWMSEETWGECFLAVAAIRFAALAVNGTFRGFRFSPHIRAASSFVAIFLWLQVSWAMLLSGVGGTGLRTYAWVAALELFNFICAIRDTGRVEGRRAGDAG